MGLSDCPICWTTHCVHQCPPLSGAVEGLLAALQHAATCSLMQQAYVFMRDNPEDITACLGCKNVLLLLKRVGT